MPSGCMPCSAHQSCVASCLPALVPAGPLPAPTRTLLCVPSGLCLACCLPPCTHPPPLHPPSGNPGEAKKELQVQCWDPKKSVVVKVIDQCPCWYEPKGMQPYFQVLPVYKLISKPLVVITVHKELPCAIADGYLVDGLSSRRFCCCWYKP